MIASFIQVFIQSCQRAIGPGGEDVVELSMIGTLWVSTRYPRSSAAERRQDHVGHDRSETHTVGVAQSSTILWLTGGLGGCGVLGYLLQGCKPWLKMPRMMFSSISCPSPSP